ncbi:tetratricopeptide repeat protein [Aquamicrobium segne]|uniref:Tetratricopeptide repeat protein n=1 Tax=Aquamicrobium segne TaxID=469547 RepID=A0ABW0GUV8_9HYPH
MIASSRHLEKSNPDVALALYPLNVEALLVEMVGQLNRQETDTSLEEMEAQIRAAVPANAGDARIYSLLGEVLRRGEQVEAAYAMFDHALELASTEIHALQWSVYRAVADADHDKAMEALDLMFRRWPERVGSFASAMPQVFSQENSYAALLEMVAQSPPWRSRLIAELSSYNFENLDFTAQFLQDLASSSAPPSAAETATLLGSLFAHKRYDLAYRTFLFTLAEAEGDLAGFVFNGQFVQNASGRRFDWMIRPQPGVSVTMPFISQDSSLPQGLFIEFGSTPVLRVGVEQTIMLPAGSYELEFTATATSADLPKSLLWAIDCLDPGQPVQRLEVPEGTYQNRSFQTRFTIAQNCPVQSLSLRTNAMVESWSNRYGGKILFHQLRIMAVPS